MNNFLQKQLIWYVVLCLSMSLFQNLTAQSQSLILDAVKDNSLYEDENGTLANGGGDHLFVGKTNQGKLRRALVEFDLSALPENIVIDSVRLTLTLNKTTSAVHNTSLHKVTQDWGEGEANAGGEEGQGTVPSNGEVTWKHTFQPDELWTNPGGDFVNEASVSLDAGVDEINVFTGNQLTADVRSWLADSTSNHGWIIIGNEAENKTAKRFSSRESGNGPKLEVFYAEAVPQARVQFIHNAPDPAAATVDVYLDGVLMKDDFVFRSATGFMDAPAGVPVSVAIAPANSQSAAEALETFDFTFTENTGYIIMASGVLDPAQFDASVNTDIAFDLVALENGREVAENPDNFDIVSFHGAPDVGAVDVKDGLLGQTLYDDLSYATFSEYSSIPNFLASIPVTLVITDDTQTDTLGIFTVDASDAAGQALTVMASGFLEPGNNNDGPSLAALIVTADGSVIELNNELATSIGQFEKLEGLNVYPTVTRDLLQVELQSSTNTSIEIKIFNGNGQEVLQQKLTPFISAQSIDITSFDAGTYWLWVKQGNRVGVQPIVKQ